MINQITVSSTFTIGAYIFFLLSPKMRMLFRYSPDNIYLLTAFFALFIFASVFNCFNARTDRLRPLAGLSRNRSFLLIMGAVLLLQILFVYLGGGVLRTMPLTPSELGVTALLSLSVLPAEKVRVFLWRARGRQARY
jgi:magnesium-transporting ATPase (P-type)